jgi:SAM-dependent methyltransferase
MKGRYCGSGDSVLSDGRPPSAVVRQDDRAAFAEALEPARRSAFAAGEYVEQESFMGAGEIRELAQRAGIGAGVSVLDLCCGVAGPGRFITRELRCRYLGVDHSAGAIDIARARADGLPARFQVARVPPLPRGTFEVVLLFETMLAFADKRPLLAGISGALTAGGRFAFTLEEGRPLTGPERSRMPDADTVWPIPLAEMRALLEGAGLVVRWQEDCSRAHRAVAGSLTDAFSGDAAAIAAQIGRPALHDLIDAHRLWSEWLDSKRIRKLAIVAEKPSAQVTRRTTPSTSSAAPMPMESHTRNHASCPISQAWPLASSPAARSPATITMPTGTDTSAVATAM